MTRLAAALAILAAGMTAAAASENGDASTFEYRSGCAACHGLDGKGDGPVSSQLKVPPADLTVLSKHNNGVFPFDSVYATIDGRNAIAAHGTREMPIWGERYSPNGVAELNVWGRINPSEIRPSIDPETVVRLRILAVIDYLKRIQEK